MVEADDTAEYELTISPVDNHIPEISVTVSGFGSGGEVVPSVTATFSSDGGAMLPDAVSSTWPYDTLLLPQFESDDDVSARHTLPATNAALRTLISYDCAGHDHC